MAVIIVHLFAYSVRVSNLAVEVLYQIDCHRETDRQTQTQDRQKDEQKDRGRQTDRRRQ